MKNAKFLRCKKTGKMNNVQMAQIENSIISIITLNMNRLLLNPNLEHILNASCSNGIYSRMILIHTLISIFILIY